MNVKKTTTRNRLLGTWRSDKLLTLRYCHHYYRLRGHRKIRFASMFGKLRMKYTPNFLHIILKGSVRKEKYKIVAEDEKSVVVKIYNDQLKKKLGVALAGVMSFAPELTQMKFDKVGKKTCYWIMMGRYLECFTKLR